MGTKVLIMLAIIAVTGLAAYWFDQPQAGGRHAIS
jgi:hypothetical protein